MPTLRALLGRELVGVAARVLRFGAGDDPVRMRRRFERLTAALPLPDMVCHEPVSLAGVPGELLTPHRTRAEGALMYIHGGGYVVGSPRTHRAMTMRLSLMTGMRVYVPDYRLAPEHRFPAALEDVVSAWRYLQKRESRLVLAGESAGGGLSAALCMHARDEGLRLPEKLYLLSPWLDFTLGSRSHRERNHLDPMLGTEQMMLDFVRQYAPHESPEHPGLSPLFGDVHGFPPTLVQVGSHEILLDDAVAFYEKLKTVGVTTQLTVGHGLWHAWPMFAPAVPEVRHALKQAAGWLSLD